MNDAIVAPRERARAWVKLLLAFLWAALFFYLSLGAGREAYAAWIAPMPLMVLAATARERRELVLTSVAAGLAYFIGLGNLLVIYWGKLPIGVLLGALLPAGLGYGVAIAVFAGLARRLPALLACLGFAALWAGVEYLVSITSPDGTAGSIAYSQARLPAMIQSAAWFGQFAITFLLCFAPASIAVAIARRRWGLVLPALVLLIVNGIVGNTGMNATPRETVRVGLIASDAFPKAQSAKTLADALAPLAEYERRIDNLVRQGARVILLPERISTLRAEWRDEVLARLQFIATRHGVRVIAGLGDFSAEPARNVAVLFDPSGEAPRTYIKHHLIPGFESVFAPGTERLTFGDRQAIAICKDMDFQDVSRDYGRAGVKLVYAPAWDFVTDAELHQRMSILRAVEGGFGLVRAAREGRLTVHTARGELLALAVSDTPSGELIADVPLDGRDTLYPTIGDQFPRAMLAIFALLAIAALWRRRSDAARAQPQRRGDN